MPERQRNAPWMLAFAVASALYASGCGADSCSKCGGGQPVPPGAAGVDADGDAGPGRADTGMAGMTASDEPVPEGACVPSGPSADDLGAQRTVLYSGPRALHAVAVRRGRVYVADADDGLLRMPEGSTAFERIAVASARDFLAGDLNLYWYEDAAVFRASLSASDAMPDPIVESLPSPVSLRAVDQTELYAAVEAQRAVTTFPIAGGAVTTLASSVTIGDLKLHAGFLYYSELGAGHVFRISVAGGEPDQLTSTASTELQAVETDGSELFWTDGIAILAATLDGVAKSSAIGVAGPAAQGGRSRVLRMMLVDGRLYWSDRDGNLGWTAPDGGACALIAAGVSELGGWDADETAVYASVTTDGATELWRIAH